MFHDQLTDEVYQELCAAPIVDTHSHIDPTHPTARSLDNLLGYHYFTELAHSTGVSVELLNREPDPRVRCRRILAQARHFDNTAQWSWFREIADTYLGFPPNQPLPGDGDELYDTASKVISQANWTQQVIAKTNLRCVYLTNLFDDPLTDFDRSFYIPCLRTDDLVFHLGDPHVLDRLQRCTNVAIFDWRTFRQAIEFVFDRFVRAGARACAISLPPSFTPQQVVTEPKWGCADDASANAVFWLLAEMCNDFRLPFDLMIGVNRQVYTAGVHQGQDLFDQRGSLIQYAELFNRFPDVRFPVSILSSHQNHELASYSWIFPNVYPHGHWWYANMPAHIESNLRDRLQAVPRTKILGYYSDAYKLEFILPKFNMYRRVLAKLLVEEFIQSGRFSREDALELGRQLLVDNARAVFESE